MYDTDRGAEELARRRGEEEVSFDWLAERFTEFVNLNPEFENAIDRLATWLARLDDLEEE
jgi:DNA-binding PadR family transcriptional regulator